METRTERKRRIAALSWDYRAAAKEPVRECNLCESTVQVEVSRVDRYGYPARFLLCRECGLGYLSPRLTASAYADFYGSVYRPLVSAYHGRRIDAETVQEDQIGYARELADFIAPLVPSPPRTVLDVGGSTGVVARAFVDAFGSEATVLDPSADELAVAEAQGMDTVQGFAEEYQPGERAWDLVLLCQTIDHLLDIRATLAALRRMTAAGGHAFVDVLDFGFMLHKTRSAERAVKVDHPFYLTRTTAGAFFAAAGYAIAAERLSDDGHWGFLLRSAEPVALERPGLAKHAEDLLASVWSLRAASLAE